MMVEVQCWNLQESCTLKWGPYIEGENVLARLSSFIEPGTHSRSVLSASGSISSAILRQFGPLGGISTYEGYFEMLNLNGSFTIWEGRICTCLEVSLVCIMLATGGGSSPLIAARPTQIVVGIFKDDEDPIPEVRQPEQIARMAEVNDNSGTPASVLLEPTDKEAKTPTLTTT
ncbi:hypothetical protein BT93_L5440 [Corymbia citriodora subsp. variegata]|uniref:AT-hook motif nuclear-localized protein n=1 Tax=Corymbia citriodora subsp. variegata TaxID=360336 RepID=A0A8T0CSD9_CORYI|nr:hypothetical protein BT93_L5440 [Corymbia citriodora subsp. variegata]